MNVMNYIETAETSGTVYAESPLRILGRNTEQVGWPMQLPWAL